MRQSVSGTVHPIHPLIRGADIYADGDGDDRYDSSPHTRGRLADDSRATRNRRFIPSYEGQTFGRLRKWSENSIHPLIRGADAQLTTAVVSKLDSSPHTRGRHSVFMRLSAVANTSLCNLHKCCSCLIHIFNMPKNPPHFHFFNYFFVFQFPSQETFRLRMI